MTPLDRGRRPGPLTRRRFLQLCAVSTSGLALSVACGQQAPAPAKPAESKPAESKPAAAAPTAVPTIAAPVVPQSASTVAPTQAAPAAKPAAVAGPTGTVNVIQQLPITTLDANMEQSLANLNPAIHMADPLVFRDPNGNVKPHLATAWSYPDEKTLRFKIRQGVKFHNGDAMTTEDVAFTFTRLLDPKTDSRHTPTLAAIGEVKAVDAETVDFILKNPDATLLGRLSILPVIPKKYFDSVGGTDAFGQKPVGTGPFKFVEWVKGQRVVMEANPDYWQGPPKIKQIIYRQISEDNTRITELLTGTADLVNNVPPALAAKVKAEPKTELQTVRGLRNVYLKINTKKAPFTDLKVRQALNHAIDVKLIVETVLGGNAVPTPGGYEGPGVWGYFKDIDKERYPFDPNKAKALLAEAGVKPGPLNIISAKGRLLNDAEVVQAIAGMLQNIGFTPQIQLLDFTVVNDEWNRKYREELDLHLWSNANNTADADYNYSTNFYSKNTGLYWSTPEMDAAILKAKTTLDTTSREAQYQEIGKKLLDEAVAVPMYDQMDSYGTSKKLKGFQARADELMYLYGPSVEG
jgi:peptide/nickel transport system substrate-binding protein